MEPDFIPMYRLVLQMKKIMPDLDGGYFDPTETIGYLVILGVWMMAPQTISLVIYKSEDAGESWNLLPVSDFSTLNHLRRKYSSCMGWYECLFHQL